ncbi:hypothetical protein MATL_G00112140 [Megalops atlanticus]|uniref:Rho guanine nucleotide exchange factor 19 n=1 Tax=Megalops atlanticus TaxID=7932 RepID=A0A9D3TE44_MEGAT|nr:hypothetical protein MATL_G00112140 [Megalops atlanticus]
MGKRKSEGSPGQTHGWLEFPQHPWPLSGPGAAIPCELPCVPPAMLPVYGLSPLPDFQPHLHSFCCRGNSPDMWIPGSPESQALSEARKDRPYLRHRHHIAVCKQESLAFFDLPQSDVNGLGFPSLERQCSSPPPEPSKPGWTESRVIKSDNSSNIDVAAARDRSLHDFVSTNTQDGGTSERPAAASLALALPLPRPRTPPLSLPLSLPVSALPSGRESLHSQCFCSSTSSLGLEGQSPEMCSPPRRPSQGLLQEKSIRRKIKVYSPESLSDESLNSPSLDSESLFPGPCEVFLGEEQGLATPAHPTSPFLTHPAGGAREPQAEPCPSPSELAGPPVEDRGRRERMGLEDTVALEQGLDWGSLAPPGGEGEPQAELCPKPSALASPPVDDRRTRERVRSEDTAVSEGPNTAAPPPRTSDQERRRFSASELISRLQLSQRKSSFTLKLGKSLSARVASRDRQTPRSLSPDPKFSYRHRSSGGSTDSGPHSPVGPGSPLPSGDRNMSLHRRYPRQSVRKESTEEGVCTSPNLTCNRRVSRFLPSSMLYQEYSDVAINREIQRQQGAEPGIEEVACGGTTPPGNLSPTSSFQSSRGSAFSLWQDIPDVRTSGQLDTFSDEERKLQEAKFELVTSEASYMRSLTIALEHFMQSQELSECLGAQERQWLFSKLPDVKDVSERFLQDLEQRLEEDILRFDVCDIVLAHCPALGRVYLPYVTNQAYQEQTYQRLLQENPRFRAILARLEEDPICQRLPLASFLILPFQRITRLKMLVENILKRTAPGSRDEDTATKAFNELKKLIKECNSSVQSMKRMEELIHLNKKIHFEGKIFPLISQSRWLVKHGELLEVDTQTMSISGSKFKLPTRPVYLHLFNDYLLLSRRKDMWKFMVFVHAKIGELKVKDLSQKLQGISGFIFHLQLCEGPQLKHQILLKAHTESEKQRWITAMFPSETKVSGQHISQNEDLSQVQCIKSYQALEHDELTLEKADILQAKTITSDGWVEGVRLSDGEQGWFPKTYVEEIASRSARLRNLRENNRIKSATQKLEEELQ